VNVTINAYLDRLKIVFWVIFGVLLGLECALAITRGVGFGANVFIIVSGVMYIVVVIGTVIFFAITGIRLFKALKKTHRALSDPEKRMRKLKRVSRCKNLSNLF
jgi:predicted membrane channel-forming protein YqfA (hemolysin III family)